MPTRATGALCLLAVLVFAAPALAQSQGGSIPVDLKPTGEFNIIAFGIVALVIFGLSALLWMLQLFVAKALVFLIPILCGVLAAVFIPSAQQTEGGHMMVGLIFIAIGTGGSLACMIYASIYDLRRRVAQLEGPK